MPTNDIPLATTMLICSECRRTLASNSPLAGYLCGNVRTYECEYGTAGVHRARCLGVMVRHKVGEASDSQYA